MIEVVLFLVVVLSIPAAMLWLVVEGLRTGVVRAKLGSVARAEDPVGYWITIAVYVGLFAMGAYLVGTIGLYAWQDGWN